MMEQHEIEKKILELISKTISDKSIRITLDSKIREDLLFDSLGVFNLVKEIQFEFCIRLSIEKLPDITTVAELVNEVGSLLKNISTGPLKSRQEVSGSG